MAAELTHSDRDLQSRMLTCRLERDGAVETNFNSLNFLCVVVSGVTGSVKKYFGSTSLYCCKEGDNTVFSALP